MILAVAGPPCHVSPEEVLSRRTLPELLALYIHTRNWQRERAAERWEAWALRMELEAVLRGASPQEAHRFARPAWQRAEALRRPEAEPELPPLDADTRRFLGLA
jgi:hypothetical protein